MRILEIIKELIETNMDLRRSITKGLASIVLASAFLASNTNAIPYMVKPGDTVTHIAKRNGKNIEELKKYNPELNPDKIKIGQRINLSQEDLDSSKKLEKKVDRYEFLDVCDPKIERAFDYFREQGFTNLPPRNIVKGMINAETGSPKDREGAFAHDPMQTSNKGDCALNALKNKEENTYLIADFSFLNGKKNAPWKNGKWDYSESNMNQEDSIKAGIGWLIHKAAHYGYKVNDDEVKTYKVRSGDTFDIIASRVGSSRGIIQKLNPDKDSRSLKVKDTIRYQTATPCIKSFRSWEDAVALYNGGGDPEYTRKVYSTKAELERRDAEKLNSSR